MSGHTKGPWEVAPRIGRYQVIPATEQERHKLASINALEFEALSVGTPNGQMALIPLDESNLANARLIAAAPDLLRSAEMVMIWWEEAQYETTGDRGEYNVFSGEPDFVAAARDAITKSKGES